MPAVQVREDATSELFPEDVLRAQMYGLLARFLARPPDAALLQAGAGISGGDTPFGAALTTLAKLCGRATPDEVSREYHALFIGLGRGELLPFASYYLSGFLNEKPLAKLRDDMARLGLERDPAVKEPEDHIAALMDIMAGLVAGDCGHRATLAEQRRFFDAHVAPWASYFFADLEAAKASVLYAALGTVGLLFLAMEEEAFAMS